jgi:hypothetical protein
MDNALIIAWNIPRCTALTGVLVEELRTAVLLPYRCARVRVLAAAIANTSAIGAGLAVAALLPARTARPTGLAADLGAGRINNSDPSEEHPPKGPRNCFEHLSTRGLGCDLPGKVIKLPFVHPSSSSGTFL